MQFMNIVAALEKNSIHKITVYSPTHSGVARFVAPVKHEGTGLNETSLGLGH